MADELKPSIIKYYEEMPFEQWIRFVSMENKNQKQLGRLLMRVVDYSDKEVIEEIEQALEQKVLPAGTEVKARIIQVRSGVSDKNDCDWYNVRFDVPAEPLAKEFTCFFWDPVEAKSKVEPKQQARNLYQFQQFTKAFNIDLSRPFTWEDDLPGLEGWLILGVRQDDVYGDQNTVRKFVVGQK